MVAQKAMASVSGGKDSIAMALRLWELGCKFTIVSVFTEFEFPAIKQQVYKLVNLTDLPHIILETPKGTWDRWFYGCLLYTSPSPRDLSTSRMPSSA